MATTIDTNPAPSLAINDANNTDTIAVTDGPAENGFQTTQVATATNTTIFANKSAVTIDGGNKGDSLVFDNPDPAAGLQSLIVQNLGTGSTINGGNANANSPDVTATSLNLTAGTGIGTNRPLQTQVSTLRATAGTGVGGGGINIFNGVSTPVTLNATLAATNAAGGFITLTNNGSINTNGITATGSINIDAIGATADFDTGSGGGITSNQGSIDSLTTGVGEDTNLGDGVGGGSMSAATGINWSTGRNFTMNANATVTNSTSGNIFITAGTHGTGDITMLTSPGSLANAPEIVNNAAGGTISLTALGNGSLTVDSTGTTAIQSNNGAITLAAGAMVINKAVNAGTNVVTLGNSSAGQAIALGAGNSPGVLGLTQAELNRITAGVVRIGSPTAGSMTIASPIANLANSNVLSLINNGSISENPIASLAIPNLRISSAGPATLNNSSNNIGTFAASTLGAVSLDDGTHTLAVPNAGVDGVLGINTSNSAVNLTADNMTIQQIINAGTGPGAIVTLAPFTSTLNVTLGTASVAGSTFGLTNGALGWIAASVLRVDAGSGNITITGAINRTPTATAPSRYQTLSLTTGGDIGQSAALSVANLAITSGNGITLTNSGNVVDTLAFANTSGVVSFTNANANALTIGAVDGVTPSSNTGTTTTILTGGNLTFATGLSSAGTATLTSTNGAILDGDNGADVDVTAPTLVLSTSTGVGIAATPLQTQVGILNALTSAGGIFINNGNAAPATLNIGTGSGGVNVNGASGDVVLTNNGTIDVINAADVVRGPGNVTVKALGGNADINTGNSNPDIQGTGAGLVDVEAGRDINLGNNAGYGDVRSISGSIVVKAGRNLNMSNFTFIDVSGGTGTLTATAGGNITMTATAQDEIFTAGGSLALTTGAGGTLTIDSTTATPVYSSGGNITLSADTMALNKGVSAGTGNVLLQEVTAGQLIDLGTAAGGLQLTNAALNEVTATTLTIGNATAGAVAVAGSVAPAHATNLTINTGSNFTANAGSALNVGAGVLTIGFGTDGHNDTADLSGATITAGAIHVTGGAGKDRFVLAANQFTDTTIVGFHLGDTVDLANTVVNGLSFANGTLTATNNGATVATIAFSGNLTGGNFRLSTDGNGGTNIDFNVPTNDFSGTGTSDVLWFNTASGEADAWSVQNGQTVDKEIGSVGAKSPWQIVGTGDFYGTGTDDVLWFNTASGEADAWAVQNGQTVDTEIGSVGANSPWQIAGTGNFYGTGTDDVLWFNTASGEVDAWAVQNGQTVDTEIGSVGANSPWQIVGTGDFYGTGTDDVLWFNTATGEADAWAVQNGQTVDKEIGSVGAKSPWQIVGTGNFYGTGTDDVLWFNTASGEVDAWAVQNGQTVDTEIGSVGANSPWQIVGTGDFYGTGTDDVLWFNTATGEADAWAVQNGQTVDKEIGSVGAKSPWRIDQQGAIVVEVPAGNANLTALPRAELFDFGASTFGHDTVASFNDARDTIRLSSTLAANFAAIQADESSVAGGTLITLDANHSIQLTNVSPANLFAANFEFV